MSNDICGNCKHYEWNIVKTNRSTPKVGRCFQGEINCNIGCAEQPIMIPHTVNGEYACTRVLFGSKFVKKEK